MMPCPCNPAACNPIGAAVPPIWNSAWAAAARDSRFRGPARRIVLLRDQVNVRSQQRGDGSPVALEDRQPEVAGRFERRYSDTARQLLVGLAKLVLKPVEPVETLSLLGRGRIGRDVLGFRLSGAAREPAPQGAAASHDRRC